MKPPELIVLELMLRALSPAEISPHPAIRLAAAREAQALNKRIERINRVLVAAESPQEELVAG